MESSMNICEIVYATVTATYVKENINYLKVKRIDNGIEIEDVAILASMASPENGGLIFIPLSGQQVLIAIMSKRTNQAVCLGCTYTSQSVATIPVTPVKSSQQTAINFKYGKGWDITLESQENKESFLLTTAKSDKIAIDQQKRLFSIESQDGQTKVSIDCQNGEITLLSGNSNSPNGLIKISKQGVEIKSGTTNSVSIKSSGAEVKGTKIDIQAQSMVGIKGTNVTI